MAVAPGGSIELAKDLSLSRMGYGAMQLAGPHVFGPPKDRDECVRVLQTAVELGVTNIDTSDFYGPYVTNEIIKQALSPYPEGVHVVTKVGALRDAKGAWNPAMSSEQLTAAVHSNLDHLGLDVLDVVNLRLTGPRVSIAEAFGTLADLQRDGLIRHLGISEASTTQLDQAQAIAPVVTVQNLYNLANREHDEMVARCNDEGIAFAPYFPLGGFTPLQSGTLDDVAARLGHSPQQVALAWLLQRSPTIVVIPGTSSVAHLRDNIAAADLVLDEDVVAELDSIGAK